jgi:hypothetical protein
VLRVAFGIALLSAPAYGKDVQLLNPAFFGQPTSRAVQFLYDKGPDELEPYVVSVDVTCGTYLAATLHYRAPVTKADVMASLKKLYAGYEAKIPANSEHAERFFDDLWRVVGPVPARDTSLPPPGSYSPDPEHPLAVHFVLGEAADEGDLEVIYIGGGLPTNCACDSPDQERKARPLPSATPAPHAPR